MLTIVDLAGAEREKKTGNQVTNCPWPLKSYHYVEDILLNSKRSISISIFDFIV